MRRELTQEKGNASRKDAKESGGGLKGNSGCLMLGVCILLAETIEEFQHIWGGVDLFFLDPHQHFRRFYFF